MHQLESERPQVLDVRGLSLAVERDDERQTGWIMDRVSADTANLQTVLSEGFQDFIRDVMTIVVILGIMLAMKGETAPAARQFAEVLRLDPRDAAAHYNLGVLLARQGRFDEAIAHYEEALRIEPGYESASRALQEARRRSSAGKGP